ncbi:helix-turn-helix transcriptional regulator [Streptomyces sp. CHD11]|uniref:AraC family transcriptional regulator n=1 Tax=Streptomyces sp. CHD11 TaxID=2741325 RepID=UPI001BFC4CB8|nr:AraC family transcriptional regulator [Streptomyces sp. CHD11]MBT3150092.1 helix-turn-helix transcriptional regulator [Streptomyces sp. CHD11]
MTRQATSKIDYFRSAASGVEFLLGRLDGYRYSPHVHDTFVVAALSRGVGALSIGGWPYSPRVAQLIFCNPFEVHDGAARGSSLSYRASYPSESLLHGIAAENAAAPVRGAVRFITEPVVDDPVGAAMFLQAHESSRRGGCALEAEERLFSTYAYCLSRYAGVHFAEAGQEDGSIDRAVTLLCDDYAAKVTLSDLVDEAGVPRQRLISAFRRRTGLTPHAFLLNRRIIAAKQLLRHGEKASAVAARTGFSDQAHLIRTFKARMGVTPGAYQQAVREG